MATIIDELVAILGLDIDTRSFRTGERLVDGLGGEISAELGLDVDTRSFRAGERLVDELGGEISAELDLDVDTRSFRTGERLVNELGGEISAELGLDVDTRSFRTGERLVDGLDANVSADLSLDVDTRSFRAGERLVEGLDANVTADLSLDVDTHSFREGRRLVEGLDANVSADLSLGSSLLNVNQASFTEGMVALAALREEIATELSLNVDRNSFQEGERAISALSEEVSVHLNVNTSEVEAINSTSLASSASSASPPASGGLPSFLPALSSPAKAIGLAAIALGTVATLSMKATAEIKNMADALGVSSNLLENMGNLVRPIGFNFENIADLVEELNNKIGESKGIEELKPVTESLDILKLKYQAIKDLAPEDQFKTVMDAALGLADAQQASAAVDILMGADANKILGFLKSKGQSLTELMQAQDKLNFSTEASIQGAVDWTSSGRKLITVFSSIFSVVSGLVGGVLAPYVDKLVEATIETKKWFQGIDFNSTATSLSNLESGISGVFTEIKKSMSGLGTDLKSLFANMDFSSVFSGIITVLTPVVSFIGGTFIMAIRQVIAIFRIATGIVRMFGSVLGIAIGHAIVKLQLIKSRVLSFANAASVAIGKVKAMLISAFNTIKSAVGSAINSAITQFNRLVVAAKNTWGKLKSIFSSISSSISSSLSSVGSSIGKAVGSAKAQLSSLRSTLSTVGSNTGSTGKSRSFVVPSVSQGVGGSVSSSKTSAGNSIVNQNTVHVNIKGGNTKKVASTVRREMNRANSISTKNNSSGVDY